MVDDSEGRRKGSREEFAESEAVSEEEEILAGDRAMGGADSDYSFLERI